MVVDEVMGRVVAGSPTQCMIAEIDTSRFTSGLDLNRGISILAIMVAVPPADGVGQARDASAANNPTRRSDAYCDLEVAPPGDPGPARSSP